MKADRQQPQRHCDRPDSKIRFYLFYGPDEAGSRALAARLGKGLGADERVDLAGAALKGDPARLADEAGAISLFGGRRLIWLEPAGDEITPAVEALLTLATWESPAVAIGGALKKTSTLVKLAEAHGAAIAHQSYAPEGRDAERLVSELGRAHGLRVDPEQARQIAAAAGNHRGVIERELEKYALYLAASPEAPATVDNATLDLIGIGDGEADTLGLGDLALAGRGRDVAEELAKLDPGFNAAIPIVRAIQRRIRQAAPMAARTARGEAVGAVMASVGKTLFFKDKPTIEAMLRCWTPGQLSAIDDAAAQLERRLLFSDVPQAEALGEYLLGVARAAARRG